MSNMSSPTPIYTTKRPEDLANLNRILSTLSIDQRARILAQGHVTLTKTQNSVMNDSTGPEIATIATESVPMVLAWFKDPASDQWYQMPFTEWQGSSSGAMSAIQHLSIANISTTAGICSIKFRATVGSTYYASTRLYHIYYIAFKDKLKTTN